MKRLLLAAFGLVALVLVLAVAVLPWGAASGAQEGRSLYVNVTEMRWGWNENLPDGGTCSFTGQTFGMLSTVPMHIIVEDEEHHTVAAQEVGGTILHTEGDEWYRCDATFEMPVPDAEFYTIRINDVHWATVPGHRLEWTPVIIVLESGEDWRPVG